MALKYILFLMVSMKGGEQYDRRRKASGKQYGKR